MKKEIKCADCLFRRESNENILNDDSCYCKACGSILMWRIDRFQNCQGCGKRYRIDEKVCPNRKKGIMRLLPFGGFHYGQEERGEIKYVELSGIKLPLPNETETIRKS